MIKEILKYFEQVKMNGKRATVMESVALSSEVNNVGIYYTTLGVIKQEILSILNTENELLNDNYMNLILF